MLCAIFICHYGCWQDSIILFLKYDPSDVIVTLGGFIWGPMTSCIVSSVIVATLEMITVSDTGILGCIMNIVQTLSFACTASVIYKKHTLSGAVIGLASGWLITVIVMLLWNYLVTPLYMGYPEAVVELLLPAFLPFNLLKGG